jgi:hypothetical protein
VLRLFFCNEGEAILYYRGIAPAVALLFFANSAAVAEQLNFGPVKIGQLTLSSLSLPYNNIDIDGKKGIELNGFRCLASVPPNAKINAELMLEIFDAGDPQNPFAFIHASPMDLAPGLDTDCSFSGNGLQKFVGKIPNGASLQVKRIETVEKVELKKLLTK